MTSCSLVYQLWAIKLITDFGYTQGSSSDLVTSYKKDICYMWSDNSFDYRN